MKPTAAQLMFEAICDVFEWDPAVLPKIAKARIGRVGTELREVGATPEMVRFARVVLDDQFAPKTYGPEAIALWWGEVDKRWRKRQAALHRKQAEPTVFESPSPDELAENRARWRQMVDQLGLGTTRELLDDVQ